jgi:hypothetical protein
MILCGIPDIRTLYENHVDSRSSSDMFTESVCPKGIVITFAYIDPGAGGILIQLILAMLVGVAYWFRRAIARIFKKRDKQ